jgi:undecaprenyl-diphosphatase
MFENIDTHITLFINSLHCGILDFLMFHVTHFYCSVVIYICVILAFVVTKKTQCWRDILILILAFAVILVLVDSFIKPSVARLRPCNTAEIQGLLHTIKNYKSNSFSFLSSHAATSFFLATFTHLALRKKYLSILLFSWATIYSYSRIYLGVHFFGDVLCGIILGVGIGILINWCTFANSCTSRQR